MKRNSISRRTFIAGACAVTALETPARGVSPESKTSGTFCLFSKHLPEMDWSQLARSVKQLGFGGVDLTVRKGGHVLPERAEEDLPKAVAAIRQEGLEVPMITTELLSGSPPASAVLRTAGNLGIRFVKPGYYRYEFVDVRRELESAGRQFRTLVDLAAGCGVQIGYHNHSAYVGAPVWDMARVIDPMDPKTVGYYFDICHAVTEGGLAGWKIAANLVADRVKMIAVKDFYWEKSTKGWRVRMCPLGEGMVDWAEYFRILKSARFKGPISLHLEYEIPGATPSARQENTLAAAERDLAFLKARI